MPSVPHPYAVIDAHTHVHPDHAPTLARIMRANHIEAVVNLGILERLGIPFDDGMRAYRRALGDRMVYFPAPDFRDASPGFGTRMARELEAKAQAGARGLKIFKELGLRHVDDGGSLIPVDDERLDPLWEKAGELGLPVLIHTADPLAFFRPLDEANERWAELQAHPDWHFAGPQFPDHDTLLAQRNRVMERHPGTIFIGAHLGNYPEDLDYVDRCLGRFPNFHVDMSSRIGEIGRHRPERARAFFEKHQDRILFGTDIVLGWDVLDDRMPHDLTRFEDLYRAHWRFLETRDRQIEYPEYPAQGDWRVDGLGLPDGVLEKLYRANAQRLIPGLPTG